MTNLSKKTVLVTGASSGIGQATALYLARQGYTVLATVRKQTDMERLNSYGLINLQLLCPLDLTNQEQIRSIASIVKGKISNNELPPLYAMINVAGGGQIAPIELMDIGAYRDELEKRLVGPVALLQELLPFLRFTRGRVVWISTPGLLPVPYVADIHAADFAVNYLARTLNVELRPDGIRNILIRCGGIKTSSPERTEERLAFLLNDWPKDIVSVYKERLIKLQNGLSRFNSKRTEPEEVAKVISKALISKRTKVRYQVGYMSGIGSFMEMLPQAWVDFIMGKREK